MSGGIQRSTSAAIKYLRGKSCWDLTLNWNTTIEMIEHCLWRVRNDATDCQKEFLENLMKLHQTHWNEHNFMLHLPTRNLYEGCTFIHLGTAETSNCRKLSGILWRKIFWLKGWTSWLLTVIADNCILLIASYQWATNLDSVSAGFWKRIRSSSSFYAWKKMATESWVERTWQRAIRLRPMGTVVLMPRAIRLKAYPCNVLTMILKCLHFLSVQKSNKITEGSRKIHQRKLYSLSIN